MARERRVSASSFLAIAGLFFVMACRPLEEPHVVDATSTRSASATMVPTTTKTPPAITTSPQSAAQDISPLPSDLMFTLGESNGAYWLDMVTVFDELPCGNFRLVASHQSPEPDAIVIDVEGFALDGEDCLESIGPAGARIVLGSLAAEAELRFRYGEVVDLYSLETGPGLLIIEAVSASFTRSGYDHWGGLPFLLFGNPFNNELGQLPEEALLFYTTSAWNGGDATALREAAVRLFEQVLALGAEPLTGESIAHGLYYPTPPLDIEGRLTHIVRYFHYAGPLAPVEELMATHTEIEMVVFSQGGGNALTAIPRNTPLPTSTPTTTRTPPLIADERDGDRSRPASTPLVSLAPSPAPADMRHDSAFMTSVRGRLVTSAPSSSIPLPLS